LGSKLLADENIPWPLVRLLRNIDVDITWIPETPYRGISDEEIIDLANETERIVLTRDNDFLKPNLRKRAEYGLIYVGEPVRKDNIEIIVENTIKALEEMKGKPCLVIVKSSTIEIYPLKPL
jgi:predicted nuclease of predicted toxin-antitoxin system